MDGLCTTNQGRVATGQKKHLLKKNDFFSFSKATWPLASSRALQMAASSWLRGLVLRWTVFVLVHACLDYTLMDYSHLDYRHLDYLWRLDYVGIQGHADYAVWSTVSNICFPVLQPSAWNLLDFFNLRDYSLASFKAGVAIFIAISHNVNLFLSNNNKHKMCQQNLLC